MRISPDAKDPNPGLSITHCERCHVRKLLDLVSYQLATELIARCWFSGEDWL